MKQNPLPTGELQGDTSPLRDRGTGSGVTDTYGADTDQDATNRIRGISGGTRSDTPFEHGNSKDGDK